jgi:hypothetical protein
VPSALNQHRNGNGVGSCREDPYIRGVADRIGDAVWYRDNTLADYVAVEARNLARRRASEYRRGNSERASS